MCQLFCNKQAHDAFEVINRIGDGHLVQELIEDANLETTEESGAYHQRLYRVSQFGGRPAIKNLMKMHLGRHRVYSLGHHSNCRYDIPFVMVFKKSETDTPNQKRFQDKLVKLVNDLSTRPTEEIIVGL